MVNEMKTMATIKISNSDNLIDSRDVWRRIEYLEGVDLYLLESNELVALKALAKEGEAYSDDWHYGETLIRDSHFEDYAHEFASEMSIPDETLWPCNCIDWARAARELQKDYTAVNFDGVAYWIRST